MENKLEVNLDEKRKVIKTDSYAMSIGELVNMYKDGELILRPEYQRYFRWKNEQKSKLIESILIGLPLPTFFMAQDKNGLLEVVDGMQRLSTIFDFIGVLGEEHKSQAGYSVFDELSGGLYYLNEFSGKAWRDFTNRIQIDFKRSKIQIVIMLRETDSDAKFELFQRLNSGGTSISGQELRNAIMASESNEMLAWIDELASVEDFRSTCNLPDSSVASRYDMELVLRFIVFLSKYADEFKKFNSVDVFLTHILRNMIRDGVSIYKAEFDDLFKKTFTKIKETNLEKPFISSQGKFSIGRFEAIALGVAMNIEEIEATKLRDKIELLNDQDDFKDNIGAGINAKKRTLALAEFGNKYFSNI